MTMVTDPARRYKTDPGNPDICNVQVLHRIFATKPERIDEIGLPDKASSCCVDDDRSLLHSSEYLPIKELCRRHRQRHVDRQIVETCDEIHQLFPTIDPLHGVVLYRVHV